MTTFVGVSTPTSLNEFHLPPGAQPGDMMVGVMTTTNDLGAASSAGWTYQGGGLFLSVLTKKLEAGDPSIWSVSAGFGGKKAITLAYRSVHPAFPIKDSNFRTLASAPGTTTAVWDPITVNTSTPTIVLGVAATITKDTTIDTPPGVTLRWSPLSDASVGESSGYAFDLPGSPGLSYGPFSIDLQQNIDNNTNFHAWETMMLVLNSDVTGWLVGQVAVG